MLNLQNWVDMARLTTYVIHRCQELLCYNSIDYLDKTTKYNTTFVTLKIQYTYQYAIFCTY